MLSEEGALNLNQAILFPRVVLSSNVADFNMSCRSFWPCLCSKNAYRPAILPVLFAFQYMS